MVKKSGIINRPVAVSRMNSGKKLKDLKQTNYMETITLRKNFDFTLLSCTLLKQSIGYLFFLLKSYFRVSDKVHTTRHAIREATFLNKSPEQRKLFKQ